MLALFAAVVLLPCPDRVACFSVPTFPPASQRPAQLHCSLLEHQDRRKFAKSVIFQTAALAPVGALPAVAEERRAPVKPFAPLESLLPAARVKRMIDRAAAIAFQLENDASSSGVKDLLEELAGLLLVPQNFARSASPPADVPRLPARQYLESYRRRLGDLPPLERPGALLEQRGEIDAWRRLKREEREREGADEVRAALNAYTSALTFDAESYAFTAPREVRSRLIREDRLPDAKAVIASDMGVRYLYRNEVLTALEEARAELEYQLRQEELDAAELAELMRTAQKACDCWFSLIDAKEVQAAMQAIQGE